MGIDTSKHKHKLACVLTIIFCGIVSLSLASDDRDGHGTPDMQMHGLMMKVMAQAHSQMMSIRESGDTDRDFAMMMRAYR